MKKEKIYLMNIEKLKAHKVGTTGRDVITRAGELTSRKKAEHTPLAYIEINSDNEQWSQSIEKHILAVFADNDFTIIGNDYISTKDISTNTILKNFIKIATDYLKFLNISYTVTIL